MPDPEIDWAHGVVDVGKGAAWSMDTFFSWQESCWPLERKKDIMAADSTSQNKMTSSSLVSSVFLVSMQVLLEHVLDHVRPGQDELSLSLGWRLRNFKSPWTLGTIPASQTIRKVLLSTYRNT